ncbi:MAG: aldo/keto reductase [Candidatus Margulisiibacteriota bacterium]|nr:aldo/keto reductase [Candidatus Margulisiibacteriota bacterium]
MNIMYGTAWKEDSTKALVISAILAGFRAIDTANQRKHYHEAAVGDALEYLISKNKIIRDEVFIQTKFTHINGQDHRLPYNPDADHRTQLKESFQRSLAHLKVNKIDSYILHGPMVSIGISDEDWECWREMEALVDDQRVGAIGISNVSIDQLKILHEGAKIKPRFVQNRCFATQGWDKAVREFCNKNSITYQGFSLLTANQFVLPHMSGMAKKYKKTPEQIIFRFSQQLGILPLTGTTNTNHMAQDLRLTFDLSDNEVQAIEQMAIQ